MIVSRHNDYNISRSIWEHKDPEGLLKRFSGKGHTVKGEPGMHGFRESVDFKEHIGVWKNLEGVELPTTRGTIHHSLKKGAHIVPSDPNPKF